LTAAAKASVPRAKSTSRDLKATMLKNIRKELRVC
jgi:hypothetical protein